MIWFASLLIGLAAVRGFRYTVTEGGLALVNTESFLWVPALLFFVCVLYMSFREKDRRLKGSAILFGLITGVFYIIGVSMEKRNGIGWIRTNTGVLLNMLNLFFSHAVLYFCGAFLAFRYLARISHQKGSAVPGQFSVRRAMLIWIILVLIYLPWYLFCFPGVISQDTADQINDAVTLDGIRDHHSAFLTLMMRFVLLPVRSLTGSMQTGVALISLLQMLIVAFVFAAAFEWIRRYVRNRTLQALIFLWYAVYPINNLYSVTLWKDVLFSVSFLALLLCLDAAAEDELAFFADKKQRILLTALLLLLPLMRHNGILISVLTGSAMLFCFPGHRRQVLMILCGFVACFGFWKLAALPLLHAEKIDPSNVYSVLEQQMARALNVHHGELTDGEMAEYTAYFDIGDIWDRYRPHISDPVKRHFRNDLFEEDPGGFFTLWAKLGRRYPLDYIEAFLANNYGYWFPETRYVIIDYGVTPGEWDIGDIHAAPVSSLPLIPRIFDYISGEKYEKIPLLPLFFSRGACFWLWVFCGCWGLWSRDRKLILVLAGLSLWLGILISPVYNEYRYVYGLFVGLPLLMAVMLSGQREKDS